MSNESNGDFDNFALISEVKQGFSVQFIRQEGDGVHFKDSFPAVNCHEAFKIVMQGFGYDQMQDERLEL